MLQLSFGCTLNKEEQSMKKLAAVFLTLLFASTASAQVISNPTTNARMDGMGVANWQIEDDFNIFINPAQLSNYKNVVYGELGTDPCSLSGGDCGNASIHTATGTSGVNNRNVGAFGGMNMDVSYGGWGVYLGRPYSPTGPLTLMGSPPPTANRFDLFYALHGAPAGFYLSYASRSTESKGGGTKVTDQASEFNLGGGVLINNMLDAAINLGLPSSKCSNDLVLCPGATVKGDAGMNISLLGRLHTGMGGNSKLLTTGQILLGDASSKCNGCAPTTLKDKLTSTTIRVDTAINSKPNPATLIVAGIGIVSSSTKDKLTGAPSGTDTSLVIPVNVGIEHQTFKAVKTRVGLTKAIYNTSTDKNCVSLATDPINGNPACAVDGQKATTVKDGSAIVSMGLGWAVADNLTVDAVINQDILFTGSYFVSGIPETLNSKLSATYRF
jgi:hypothetical protein